MNFLKMQKITETELLKKAEFYTSSKQYFEAARIYDYLIRAKNKYEYGFELMRSFFLLNNLKEAIYTGERLVGKIKDDFVKAKIYELLAFSYMREENYDKANENFGRAVELTDEGEHKHNLQLLYAVSFIQKKDIKKAITLMEELALKKLNADKKLELYLNLLTAYIADKQLKKALATADFLLKTYKEFSERFNVFNYKINILLELNKIEEAQKMILQEKEKYPGDEFANDVFDKLLKKSYVIQSEVRDGITEYGGLL